MKSIKIKNMINKKELKDFLETKDFITWEIYDKIKEAIYFEEKRNTKKEKFYNDRDKYWYIQWLETAKKLLYK